MLAYNNKDLIIMENAVYLILAILVLCFAVYRMKMVGASRPKRAKVFDPILDIDFSEAPQITCLMLTDGTSRLVCGDFTVVLERRE